MIRMRPISASDLHDNSRHAPLLRIPLRPTTDPQAYSKALQAGSGRLCRLYLGFWGGDRAPRSPCGMRYRRRLIGMGIRAACTEAPDDMGLWR